MHPDVGRGQWTLERQAQTVKELGYDAHIAIKLGGEQGKKLNWNPEAEQFDNDAANALKSRPSWREPWTLEKLGA